MTEFFAVEIDPNDLIKPYLAFNGTSMLHCHETPYDSIKLMADVSVNFESEPFWIKVDYPLLITNKDPDTETITESDIVRKKAEFIFNGIEFIGDYETSKERMYW